MIEDKSNNSNFFTGILNFLKKRIATILVFLFVGLFVLKFLHNKSNSTEFVPDKIVQEGLNIFTELIDSNNYEQFGLTSKEQAFRLVPGKQFKRYFIELSKIQNYNGIDSIFKLVNRNYSIEIPLSDSTRKDKFLTSIEFKVRNKCKWEPIAFGSSALFRKFLKDPLVNKSSSDIYVVDVHGLNTGFFYYSESNNGSLKSKIISKNNYLSKDSSLIEKTYSDPELLNLLKKMALKVNFNYPG